MKTMRNYMSTLNALYLSIWCLRRYFFLKLFPQNHQVNISLHSIKIWSLYIFQLFYLCVGRTSSSYHIQSKCLCTETGTSHFISMKSLSSVWRKRNYFRLMCYRINAVAAILTFHLSEICRSGIILNLWWKEIRKFYRRAYVSDFRQLGEQFVFVIIF